MKILNENPPKRGKNTTHASLFDYSLHLDPFASHYCENRMCIRSKSHITRAIEKCAQAMIKQLTPVADNSYRWRGEDEYALPKQRELPQHHYLLPEKLDELGHAASRVGDLQGASSGKCGHFWGYVRCFRAFKTREHQ